MVRDLVYQSGQESDSGINHLNYVKLFKHSMARLLDPSKCNPMAVACRRRSYQASMTVDFGWKAFADKARNGILCLDWD